MKQLTFLGHYSSQNLLPDFEGETFVDFDNGLWTFYNLIINRKTKLDKDWPTKSEFRKWLDVYFENFTKDELVGNETNLLIFEKQKISFFLLIAKQYHKYGHTFSFTYKPDDYGEGEYDDFLFLHTLFALKYLNYLDFENLARAKEDEMKRGRYYATVYVGYQCKIMLKQAGLDILKKLEDDSNKRESEEKIDHDIIEVQTKAGLLIFNKNTGFAKLKDFEVKENLNPQGQEAEALLKLMTGKDHQATYKDFLGENALKGKGSRRNLAFVIRNIKKILGILPAKKAKNKDCVKNIRGVGYKLIC